MTSSTRWQVAAAVVLLIGTGIRIGLYLSPHALWADEVSVAYNIVDRTISGLLGPLDHAQHAPVGFVILTKIASILLGHTEQGFRLVSIVCGIAFPIVMWRLARRHLSDGASTAVAALAALSPTLIAYSVQLKPYASDALAAAAVLALYFPGPGTDPPWAERGGRTREVVASLLAATLVLFSFPAIFCLCGLLAARGLVLMLRGDMRGLVRRVLLALPWLVTFGVYSALLLSRATEDDYLQRFWASAFLQWPISPAAIRTDLHLLLQAMGPNVGLNEYLGAFLFACAALHALGPERRPAFWAVLSILGVTAGASLLHRWPMGVRLLLFAAPLALLLAGWALESVAKARRPVVMVGLTLVLLIGPAADTNDLADSIGVPSGARAVAIGMEPHVKPGDVVYVYYLAYAEADFYRRLGIFPDLPIVHGVDLIDEDWSEAARQIDAMDPNARVWVVFANSRNSGYDERQATLSQLARTRPELLRVSEFLSLFGPAQ